MRMREILFSYFLILFFTIIHGDTTPQNLPYSKFDWRDNDITLNNDWSSVPGWVGYKGVANSKTSLNFVSRTIDTTKDTPTVHAGTS